MSDTKLLDQNGLLYTWQKIKTLLNGKVDKVDGKSLISDTEIIRLASLTNYDDSAVQSAISSLQSKVEALEQGTYDDTQLRKDIAATYATLTALSAHTDDTDIHITATERATWNAKQDKLTIDSALSASSANPVSNKAITSALSNKVDVVSGKGLSTNDYTTEEKNKLSTVSSNAQENVVETIKVNGSEVSVSNKEVNIIVPTDNNQISNGAGYQTESNVRTVVVGYGYQTASDVSNAISNALADITGISYRILGSGEYDANTRVPSVTGEAGVIYLVPKSNTEANNIYFEFIYDGTGFEKIGDTSVDLSNYVTVTDVISNEEIDTIFAS